MISKIIKEEVRFPLTNERVNSEVRTYYLSPEELEKYRRMDKPTGADAKQPMVPVWGSGDETRERISDIYGKVDPNEFTKEQYLDLKKRGFSDKRIWFWLDKNHNWMRDKKKEWGLLGHRVARK